MRAVPLRFGSNVMPCVAIVLLALPVPANTAAQWQTQSSGIRREISAHENELMTLKMDMRRSFGTLREGTSQAQQDAYKWEQTGRQERDPSMQAVLLEFRQTSLSHASFLGAIEQVLVDAAQIGEQLESHVKDLTLCQGILDDIAQSAGGGKPKSSRIRDAYDLLLLLQKNLANSAKALANLQTVMTEHSRTLKDHDRKVSALLAELGSPQDRVRQFEKEVVKTELANNRLQAKYLGLVASHAVRLSDMLMKIAETEKTQQRFVDALR